MSGYVDAHHHLWSLEEHPQTWMNAQTDAPIMRDFDADQLAAVAARCGVTATVVVQSVNDADETGHLLARAEASPLIIGVVGWADLTAPDLADQIACWREGFGGQHLVGLRHLVQNEADPTWLDRPAVRRGIGTATDAGLSFDLLVRIQQMPSAIRTAQAFPEARLVLDHLGKPPLSNGPLDEWATALGGLAAEPNVHAKVSGLVTQADWQTWSTSSLSPAIEVALEAFGAGRLMFGSDWPVCLLASSYADVVEAAESLFASRLSPAEHTAVFSRNARTFYRLPEPPH